MCAGFEMLISGTTRGGRRGGLRQSGSCISKTSGQASSSHTLSVFLLQKKFFFNLLLLEDVSLWEAQPTRGHTETSPSQGCQKSWADDCPSFPRTRLNKLEEGTSDVNLWLNSPMS